MMQVVILEIRVADVQYFQNSPDWLIQSV